MEKAIFNESSFQELEDTKGGELATAILLGTAVVGSLAVTAAIGIGVGRALYAGWNYFFGAD